MSEKFPRYSYGRERLISIGLFCSSVIGFSLISLFIFDTLRGRYHTEPFLYLTELIVCLGLCFISYISAAQLTIHMKRTLQRFVSDWLSISAFGSFFFGALMASFLYIDTLTDLRNYRELSFWISGTPPRPILPTAEHLIIYALAFGATACVSTSVLYQVFRPVRD